MAKSTEKGSLKLGTPQGSDVRMFPGKELLIATTEHLVYYEKAPLLMPEARAWYLVGDTAIPVRKGNAGQSGGIGRKYNVIQSNTTRGIWSPPKRAPVDPYAGWVPTGEMVEYDVPVVQNAELDPHVIFYSAAAELRERIALEGQALANDISAQGGPSNLAMITVVHTPIMSMPNQEKGYRLWTSLSQFAAEPDAILNRDEAYSTTGDVPLDTPDAITLKMLTHAEDELEEMGVIDRHRNVIQRVPGDALVEAVRRARRKESS